MALSKLFSGFSQLSSDEVQVTDRFLGRGAYASVYEVCYNGVKCAGKRLHNIFFHFSVEKNQQSDAKDAVMRFSEECRLLSGLKYHPNIVQYRGIYQENGVPAPMLVMEYLPTSIDCLIEKCGKIPSVISYHLLRDIALGLAFLHNGAAPIIHRDLTAKNVLISTNLRAKIADFGMATSHIRLNKMTQAPGNFVYMPPESMSANPSYDASVDIFSYGVLAIYMLSGTLPIPRESAVRAEESGGLRAIHEFMRRYDYLEMIGFDHPSITLIFQCIDNDPSLRGTAADIISQMTEIVAKHPASISCTEIWKTIVARLERNEDVTDLITSEQSIQEQGHQISNVHTAQQHDDGNSSHLQRTMRVASGRQEETNEELMGSASGSRQSDSRCSRAIVKHNETHLFNELIERCFLGETVQVSEIVAAAIEITKGYQSLPAVFSKVSNLERILWQFSEVAFHSLRFHQVIATYMIPHCLRGVQISAIHSRTTDKTNITRLVTQFPPTTNCSSNMEIKNSPIMPHRHHLYDAVQRIREGIGTCHQQLLAMHTTSSAFALNGQQTKGYRFSFTLPYEALKEIMLLLQSVYQHKGDLSMTVSRASLINLAPVLQALSSSINSALARFQELKLTPAQLLALNPYLSAFSSELKAIWIAMNRIEAAVTTLINMELSEATCFIHCVDVYTIKRHLRCKYAYQDLELKPFPSIFTKQSHSTTFVVCETATPGMLVSPSVAYPIRATATLGVKSHTSSARQFSGKVVIQDDPHVSIELVPSKDTCSLLQNGMCSPTISQLTDGTIIERNGQSKLQICITPLKTKLWFNMRVSFPTKPPSMEITNPKVNAKINWCDHMLQPGADKANQLNNIENSRLALSRQLLGINISPLKCGKPRMEIGTTPQPAIGCTSADDPNLITKSEATNPKKQDGRVNVYKNPPESNKILLKGHVFTSTYLRYLLKSTYHSLMDVAFSPMPPTAVNISIAADMEIVLILMENLLVNPDHGLKLIMKAQSIKRANSDYYLTQIQPPDKANTDQPITTHQPTQSVSAATECINKVASTISTISGESQTNIQQYQSTKWQPKKKTELHVCTPSQATTKGVSLSKLAGDEKQDIVSPITPSISCVPLPQSTCVVTIATSNSLGGKFTLNQEVFVPFYSNRTMYYLLTTVHPLHYQAADKASEMVPVDMYSCDKIAQCFQLYRVIEGMELTAVSKFLPTPARVKPSFVRISPVTNYITQQKHEFGKCTQDREEINITNKPTMKPQVKGKLAKNVNSFSLNMSMWGLSTGTGENNGSLQALHLNTFHLKQVACACTCAYNAGQSKLSHAEIGPFMFTELGSLDTTIYLLISKLDYHHLSLQGLLSHHLVSHALQVLGQQMPESELDQHQASKHGFSNVYFDSSLTNSERGILDVATTTTQTNLMCVQYENLHLEGKRSVKVDIWDGKHSLHKRGSNFSENPNHKYQVEHVAWQEQDKCGKEQLNKPDQYSLASWCDKSSCKDLHPVQVVPSTLFECGLMCTMTSIEKREVVATMDVISVSTLHHSTENLESRMFFLSVDAHIKANNKLLTGQKDLNIDRFTPESSKSGTICTLVIGCRPRLSQVPQPPMKTNQLQLQKSLTSICISLKHYLAIQRSSLETTNNHSRTPLEGNRTVEVLHRLITKSNQQKGRSKSLPFCVNNMSEHSSDGSSNGNSTSDKGGGGESCSDDQEDPDRGDGGERSEDSGDNGGGDGGYGDGGDSDREGDEFRDKEQKGQRPYRKKRKKKGGKRRRRRFAKRRRRKKVRKTFSSELNCCRFPSENRIALVNSRCRLTHVQHCLEIGHDQPSGAVFMISVASSSFQCPMVQQCVVPAVTILQNHQRIHHLSPDHCRFLAHRALNVQVVMFRRMWLYLTPAPHPPWPIAETCHIPNCNAIVHGRLLLRAQEQHFAVDINGCIGRNILLFPQTRLSHSLSVIVDSGLGSSLSTSHIQQAPPQLVNNVLHNSNQLASNSLDEHRRRNEDDPLFPAPIMEQNFMVYPQDFYPGVSSLVPSQQEADPLAAHNTELVIQGRRRRPYSRLQRNSYSHNSHASSAVNEDPTSTQLPDNAELVTIGRRRRPRIMLLNRHSIPPAAYASSLSSQPAAASEMGLSALPPVQISSSVRVNDPYCGFVVLCEYHTTEYIPPTRLDSEVPSTSPSAMVHNAAVRGAGSTIASNARVEHLVPEELRNLS